MCSSYPSCLQGPLRPSNLTLRANYHGARGNTNLNQNLNREPWFATFDILISVEVDVNPVFSTLKVRLCKPVSLSKSTGERTGAGPSGNRGSSTSYTVIRT